MGDAQDKLIGRAVGRYGFIHRVEMYAAMNPGRTGRTASDGAVLFDPDPPFNRMALTEDSMKVYAKAFRFRVLFGEYTKSHDSARRLGAADEQARWLPLLSVESLEKGQIEIARGIELGTDETLPQLIGEAREMHVLLGADDDSNKPFFGAESARYYRVTFDRVEWLPFELNATTDMNACERVILHGVEYTTDLI